MMVMIQSGCDNRGVSGGCVEGRRGRQGEDEGQGHGDERALSPSLFGS